FLFAHLRHDLLDGKLYRPGHVREALFLLFGPFFFLFGPFFFRLAVLRQLRRSALRPPAFRRFLSRRRFGGRRGFRRGTVLLGRFGFHRPIRRRGFRCSGRFGGLLRRGGAFRGFFGRTWLARFPGAFCGLRGFRRRGLVPRFFLRHSGVQSAILLCGKACPGRFRLHV